MKAGLAKDETEPQSSLWTKVGVALVGETPSLTGEFVGKCAKAEQGSCIVPSLALPPQAAQQLSKEVCPAWGGIPKAPPPYDLLGVPRPRNMAQIKEQSKTSERELSVSHEEIASLSDADFKTLVVRMLTEMIELRCKMKDEMKATQGEIKQNIQGTNSDRKKTRTQSNDLEQQEKINIQSEQNEDTRIQKHEERLTNLWDNLKHSDI